MQRGQERKSRAGEGKMPQDQIRHPRRGKKGVGKGQDLRVPSSC